MARLLSAALLGTYAAVSARAAASAACTSEACREPTAEAPGLLLVQARPAAAGLSRLQPTQVSLASLRGGARDGEEVQCQLGANVTLTSHRLMQLQDNGGLLNLHGNKLSWERWTLADATNGTVNVVSQFGRHLADDNGQPVLVPDGHDYARWRIAYAGNGQFFLTSHRDEHLGDWENVLTMHGNNGEWERWYINTVDGGMACTTPQAEADEMSSLRRRMLQAEDMLFHARELLTSGCATTRTTTTTGPGDAPEKARCAIFGDPHFITFDGGHTTFVGDRILWVVRSQEVWIQAVSRKATGNFMGLAVGGPFMRGHTLIVYNASDDGSVLHAEYDQIPILLGVNDEFHDEATGVSAWRSSEWNAEMHDSTILDLRTQTRFDIGPWPERFTGSPQGGLFLLRLPNNVEITITGVDFMSAVVTMAPQPNGQSGYCGDFNGEAADDFDEIAPSWNRPVGRDLGPVPTSMSLFEHLSASPLLSLAGVGVAEDPAGEEKAAEEMIVPCPEALQARAQKECAVVADARMRQDCIFDVCQTGELRAVQGMLAAEVMEQKVNTQGTVNFMGNGRCLDSAGHPYAVFRTTDVRTEAACKKLLRELAFQKGVLGAELHRTSTCQIVVDGDVDPTAVLADAHWTDGGKVAPTGAQGQAEGTGAGMVSATSEDAAWSCWAAI